MNINEHPIFKDISDLCLEIEKLPASEQQTKVVTMARELEKPTAELINALRDIKITCCTTMDGPKGLAHIVRLCIDAGITQQYYELQKIRANKSQSTNAPRCYHCGRNLAESSFIKCTVLNAPLCPRCSREPNG